MMGVFSPQALASAQVIVPLPFVSHFSSAAKQRDCPSADRKAEPPS